MRVRDGMVVTGIIVAAFWVHAALAASGLKNAGAKGAGDPGTGTAQPRLVPKGGKVDIKKTGGGDPKTWAQDRYTRSVAYLANHGVDAATAREMTLSALSHWDIEAAKGASEFNYNLAGITARDGDQYFASTDQGSGKAANFAAYDNADQGVGDYWALLNAQYPDCLKMLHDAPTSDTWIRCLGQKGYYAVANVETMASGVLARRKLYAADASIHGDGDWVDEMYDRSLTGDDFDGDYIARDEPAIVGGGSKTYGPYEPDDVDALVKRVAAKMAVTGSNPWNLDAGAHGVTLQASYNPTSELVTVTITGKNFYVSDAKVWEKLDSLMPAPAR